MIKAMLWDLGGVLCRFRPDRRVIELARRSGRSPSQVEALLDRPLLDALDRGEMDGAGLHTRIRHGLGWNCSYDDLAAAWTTAFEPDRDVLRLAARVDLPTGLLTDNGPPIADQFRQCLPDVASVVQIAVFSAEIGCTKPHPGAFLAACRRLTCDPEHVLFIDDNPVNVDGARETGLDAFRFTTADALTEVLRNRALLR